MEGVRRRESRRMWRTRCSGRRRKRKGRGRGGGEETMERTIRHCRGAAGAAERRRWTPYPGRVLLHLVLVAVRPVGVAAPEAALTQLVAVTLLAPVPETHHALTPAIRTFHRMED